MRILMTCDSPMLDTLGAPKVLIDLAKEIALLGWQCRLLGNDDPELASVSHGGYNIALRAYLQKHAHQYDVIDYDHAHLPFPRSDFDRRPLFVARSVMLMRNVQTARIPTFHTPRAFVSNIVNGSRRRAKFAEMVQDADITLRQADLVNVCNEHEPPILHALGIAPEKIVLLTFGISQERRALFDAVSSNIPKSTPTVAFVGTFDPRKGGPDFPEVVRRVARSVPAVRFKLIGTKGMFRTAEEVLACFPKHLYRHLEVRPQFQAEELPALLSDCHAGVFPSYAEGFPFAVLEMLAASLPVVAYDAPGATMTLGRDLLVPPGDKKALSERLVHLLTDHAKLSAARLWARKRSEDFIWSSVSKETDRIYREHVSVRRTEQRA